MMLQLPISLLAAFFQIAGEVSDQQSVGDGLMDGPSTPAYAWEFDSPNDTEGWQGNFAVNGLVNQADVEGVHSVLTANDTTSNDPQLNRPGSSLPLPPGYLMWDKVTARFRQLDGNPPGGAPQNFTASGTYIRAVGAVNTFQDSGLSVNAEANYWQTTSLDLMSSIEEFTNFRFDPVGADANKNFEVDWLRLYAKDLREVWVGQADLTASSYVIPFQLPSIPLGESVVTATLNLTLQGWSNLLSELGNVDLYGSHLVSSSSSAYDPAYYVDGANPASNIDAMLLQEDMVTPSDISGPSANGQTINITSDNIAAYIQQLLDGGAQPGDYAFLILAQDATLSQPAYYSFTSADASSGGPQLNIFSASSDPNIVYVDSSAAPGGDGSASSPFNDLQTAIEAYKGGGGKNFYLAEGHYDPVKFNLKVDEHLFTSPATIQADPNIPDPISAVSIEKFEIVDRAPVGSFNLNLSLQNLKVTDGVLIERGSNFEINGCRLEREGDLNGSGSNIAKKAVELFQATNVTIRNCEITHTGYGITGNSAQFIDILNNHIHTNSHDGIFITGMRDVLIEGNHIHNLDDGVDGGEGFGWNKHCDGIQLYTSGSGDGTWNERVTIRGNRIYHCESHGIIVNNSAYNYVHRDITIENNVFGPNRAWAANLGAAENLTFRGNITVEIAEGSTWQSLYRELIGDNTRTKFPAAYTGTKVYNNYLSKTFDQQSNFWVDYNYYGSKDQTDDPLARFEAVLTDPKLVNPEAFDGVLQTDSPLINMATRDYAPDPTYPDDIYGTVRDNRPDIGPYELPAQNPLDEVAPPAFVGPATLFKDDFADANIRQDPWLNGTYQQGLSWAYPADQIKICDIRDRNGDNSVTFFGANQTNWLITEQGDSWTDSHVTLKAVTLGGPETFGFLLRGNMDTEGYRIDIKTGSIMVRESSGGSITETPLAGSVGNIMPGNKKDTVYQIEVSDTAGGVTIALKDANGDVLVQGVDANSTFTSGRFGFMVTNGSSSTARAMLMDVEIDTDI